MAQFRGRNNEDKEEGKRDKRVQVAYPGLKQTAQSEDSQEGQAPAEMPVAEQAFLVRDPQVFGAQRARTMLNLQQTHGNRYVQRLAEGSGKATLDEEIMGRIEARKGSGKPLESKTRSDMEAAFNQDFGGVRIHADANAAKLARELGAKAFTTGEDIFLGEGAADLGSESGKGLLGHELAHVVQQDLSTVRGGEISELNEPAETEAQRAGEAISCDRQPLPVRGSAAQVSRQLFGGPLSRGAIFGGGGGGSLLEPAQQRQAAKPAEPVKSLQVPGQQEKQRKALMSMWNAMVVSQLEEAWTAASAEPPDLLTASDLLATARVNTSSAIGVMEAFNAPEKWKDGASRAKDRIEGLEGTLHVAQWGVHALVAPFAMVHFHAQAGIVMRPEHP